MTQFGSSLDPGNSRNFSEIFGAGFAGGGGDPGGKPSLSQSEIEAAASAVSNVDFTDTTQDTDTAEAAALRVVFLLDGEPYSPYDKLFCSVQRLDNGSKMFIGQFRFAEPAAFADDGGDPYDPESGTATQYNYANLIQVPLIGQSIEELVNSINLVENVRAEVVDRSNLESTENLRVTTFYDATDTWAYFFADDDETGTNSSTQTSTLAQDVKFYLTSVEPRIEQNNPTQSLGGFISPTEVYKTDVLAQSVSFYDNTLVTEGTNLNEASLIQVQDEVLSVETWNENIAAVTERNVYGTPLRFHPQGSIVREISKNTIFDSRFSRERTQYRCIAVRNESDTEFLKSVRVYFNLLTRNSFSNTRLAIEIPRSEYRASTASGGTDAYLIDDSLSGTFEDEHYTTSSVTFTNGGNAGQTRIIDNYNGSNGTMFFSERLPAAVQSGDAYYVDTAPSQRIAVGTEAPSTVPSVVTPPVPPFNITAFQEALFFEDGLSINEGGIRGSTTLGPRQAVYVWIERRLEDNNQSFDNNRSFVTIGYSRI